MNLKKHSVIIFALMILTIELFEIIHVDLWVESFFRDNGHWLLARDEQPWRFIFYDGIKKAFGVFAIAILIGMLFFRNRLNVFSYHKEGWWVVLLTIVTVPLMINFLKWYTDIPCPRDLIRYGGEVPYVTLTMHYPNWFTHSDSLRCYPAGHASGGFALMALFFLFKTPKWQWFGLAFGVFEGWIIGLYKMAIGDHFFSHTLVSMMLAWLVACLFAMWLKPHVVKIKD